MWCFTLMKGINLIILKYPSITVIWIRTKLSGLNLTKYIQNISMVPRSTIRKSKVFQYWWKYFLFKITIYLENKQNICYFIAPVQWGGRGMALKINSSILNYKWVVLQKLSFKLFIWNSKKNIFNLHQKHNLIQNIYNQ